MEMGRTHCQRIATTTTTMKYIKSQHTHTHTHDEITKQTWTNSTERGEEKKQISLQPKTLPLQFIFRLLLLYGLLFWFLLSLLFFLCVCVCLCAYFFDSITLADSNFSISVCMHSTDGSMVTSNNNNNNNNAYFHSVSALSPCSYSHIQTYTHTTIWMCCMHTLAL